MRKQKGFTLVELLTVISIIVILMAISLPILNGVRRRARAAVCMSNLRQWGMVYKMYTDEFDGKLPRDYNQSPWYYPISNYYSNNRKILLCPSAKKPAGQKKTYPSSIYGGRNNAWEYLSEVPEEAAWNSIGSYGLNGWAYKSEIQLEFENTNDTDINDDDDDSDNENNDSGSSSTIKPPPANGNNWLRDYWRKRFGIYSIGGTGSSGSSGSEDDISEEDINDISKNSKYLLKAYERQPDIIPLVFDCTWLYSNFDDQTGPPSSDNLSSRYSGRSNTTCIDRHDGGINMVFMDFSTRRVGLKELWTLKWNKEFNTAGPWTKAGGVQYEYWPKWIRKYKDY